MKLLRSLHSVKIFRKPGGFGFSWVRQWRAGAGAGARNALETPKNRPSVRWPVGMTIRINTDVIRNTEREREREEKFSTKKNHQINMIVYWYNDGLEISKLNKYLHIYIYLFIHLYRIAEVALSDFLNQEEIPGNHQMLAEMCRKSPTYKL